MEFQDHFPIWGKLDQDQQERLAGSLLLLRLVWPVLPFVCHALVCAGLLLPLFGLFGSPRRGAGRCRRPAAVREASRRCARIPWRYFPACVFDCRFCADFCTCCLFVRRALCVCAHFSLIFRLFLPNFFLSKFFSLVAQAATGLYFLPKRK